MFPRGLEQFLAFRRRRRIDFASSNQRTEAPGGRSRYAAIISFHAPAYEVRMPVHGHS